MAINITLLINFQLKHIVIAIVALIKAALEKNIAVRYLDANLRNDTFAINGTVCDYQKIIYSYQKTVPHE